jgi:PAS domain S-box-containing protein
LKEHVVESSAKIVLDLNDRIRVLHVDDDSGVLKITKQCLEMEGPLQVDSALSVEEALMKLEKNKYDIVVSDYQMPGKNGLDFLKALRSKGNAIPFIMFTGKGREEVAIEALNLGANQYLNKMGETETVYVELAHSITELAKTREAEEKQRESEEKFRELFEKATDGLVFVDLSGRIVDLNQKAAEIAEKRKEDIVGKSFLDLGLVSLNDVHVLLEKLGQQAMGKPTGRFEFEIKSEKGEKKFIEISSTFILRNNAPTGSLAIVRDVTERKKAEAALKETKDQLELQIKRMPIGCIVWNKDFKALSWNPAAETIFGYSAKDAIGKHPYDTIVPKEAQPAVDKIWQRLLEGDETAHSVNDNLTRDGRTITCSWTNTPLKREDNSVIGVLSMVQDITEHEKAEEALKSVNEQLNLFSAAAKASIDGFVLSDLEGRILELNDSALRLYGTDEKSDLVGKNSLDLVVPEERERIIENMKEVMIKGYTNKKEINVITKEGIRLPVEITTTLAKDTEGHPVGFLGICRDITERKKTEKALRESEERFSTIAAATFEGIGISEQAKIIDANDQLEKMLGYEPRELIGKSVLDFVAPESRDLVIANMRAGYEGPYEHLAVRKDGSVFPVEIRSASRSSSAR